MADPKTEELKVDQIAREREALARAEEAEAPEETEQHQRRAEKAAYLKEKLAERAAAEDEAAE
ncbi:MAG TPA: hypothetical protein VF533_04765 [Solirubrobacteraceae bacterium]|jgi:hypothetical protein